MSAPITTAPCQCHYRRSAPPCFLDISARRCHFHRMSAHCHQHCSELLSAHIRKSAHYLKRLIGTWGDLICLKKQIKSRQVIRKALSMPSFSSFSAAWKSEKVFFNLSSLPFLYFLYFLGIKKVFRAIKSIKMNTKRRSLSIQRW
jgi:hypothetical protein